MSFWDKMLHGLIRIPINLFLLRKVIYTKLVSMTYKNLKKSSKFDRETEYGSRRLGGDHG
jgi:hypothetical protein